VWEYLALVMAMMVVVTLVEINSRTLERIEDKHEAAK
jgi:hypothetical protein